MIRNVIGEKRKKIVACSFGSQPSALTQDTFDNLLVDVAPFEYMTKDHALCVTRMRAGGPKVTVALIVPSSGTHGLKLVSSILSLGGCDIPSTDYI